jgi:hypothetical protein
VKLITPDQQKASRPAERQTSKRHRTHSQGKCVILECGHFSNTATQEAYSAWRSSPELYLCEICGIETAGKISRDIPAQSDVPPF